MRSLFRKPSAFFAHRALCAWDILAVALALVGLAIPMVADFADLSSRYWVGSDFKTLYASTWLFVHGFHAFSIPEIVSVYRRNHIVLPPSLFGHMPVYPPFTLALLAPLAVLQATAALDLWLAVSLLSFGFALVALLRVAADDFQLSLGWRLLILAACVSSPLLSFAVDLGNVSVPVAALCIVALCRPPDRVSAVCLGVALLLKPHLAIWVLLAIGVGYGRAGRRAATRAAVLAAGFTTLVLTALAASGRLLPMLTAFRTMLRLETSSGSMSPTSRELLIVPTQILSLQSLLSFSLGSRPLAAMLSAGTVLLLLALAWLFLRGREYDPQRVGSRLLTAGTLVAIGLIATYHRAHDALLLCFLAPWLLARLRFRPRDWRLWALLLLYAGEVAGPVQSALLDRPGPFPRFDDRFLIVRQAPLCAFLLALLLTWMLVEHLRTETGRSAQKKAA